MKPRLLTLLALLSLMLCVGAVVLWVRSCWVSDALLWANGSGERGAQAVSGTWALVTTNVPRSPATLRWNRFDSRDLSVWDDGPPLSLPNRLGFGYRYRVFPTATMRLRDPDPAVVLPPVVVTRTVLVPLWLVAVLFALLPTARLYRRIRPKYAAGHCPACGYDLRASPGRCPECGQMRELL